MSQPSLHGFVGQKKIVNHVLEQLRGAQALGDACAHILCLGKSGMGKSKFVKCLAKEMGGDCRVIHGKASVKDICEEAANLSPGDFLFLDEAHTLPREAQEALYELIDTSLLSVSSRAKLPDTAVVNDDGKLVLKKITVALATNMPSLLLEALHRRMDMTVYLQDYKSKELLTIALENATSEDILCQPEALKMVVNASQGQPRRIVQIIKGVKRMFYETKKELGKTEIKKYLHSNGQNNLGLDREQRNYLKELKKFGRASIQTLSGQLGLETQYIADKIEPGLLRLGLVQKAINGRSLTAKGHNYMTPPTPTVLGESLIRLVQWAATQGCKFQNIWNALLRLGLKKKVKDQTQLGKLRGSLLQEFDLATDMEEVKLPKEVAKTFEEELRKNL